MVSHVAEVERVGGWDGAARELHARFRAGEVSPDEMLVQLPPIWASRPDRGPLDDAAVWEAMVRHAGFFTWGGDASVPRRGGRPRRSRRLYRGATFERRAGISWTAKPAIADWFARYRQPPGEEMSGQVWVAVFPPGRLLGFIRHEKEYLVDAVGVDIQPCARVSSPPG